MRWEQLTSLLLTSAATVSIYIEKYSTCTHISLFYATYFIVLFKFRCKLINISRNCSELNDVVPSNQLWSSFKRQIRKSHLSIKVLLAQQALQATGEFNVQYRSITAACTTCVYMLNWACWLQRKLISLGHILSTCLCPKVPLSGSELPHCSLLAFTSIWISSTPSFTIDWN